MGFFPCNSSIEASTRRIAKKLASLTSSKLKFYEGLDGYVSQVENYSNKRIKIFADILKIELTNTQNKSEIRYLYLLVLDKLIQKNVKFLRVAFESNLLAYIIRLSDFTSNDELFNCLEEKESKLLLSTLATSSLNNWYDKYCDLNDDCVIMLKQYKHDFVNRVQDSKYKEELEESSLCFARESDKSKISSVNYGNDDSYSAEEHSAINDQIDGEFHSKKSSKEELTGNQNFTDTIKIQNDETQNTLLTDEFEIKTNSSLIKQDGVENRLSNSEFIENDFQEYNNSKLNPQHRGNEINQVIELSKKYSKLKEKYLLLIQKNDYLQSRLDFYENYSFCLKNPPDGRKNFDGTNHPIFRDIIDVFSSIDNEDFIHDFRRLIHENDWVLFEDNMVQIGLKCYYEDAKGDIHIYFGNKLPTRLENFDVKFKLFNINNNILNIEKKESLPYYVSGKQQICVKFTVKCNDIFFGMPTLIIKFLLSDSSMRNIELPFPLVLTKFAEGIECDSDDILRLWHSDIFLLSQSSFQFDLKNINAENISELIDKCKLGGAFKLSLEDPIKDGDFPKNKIFLFGCILCHHVIIQLQFHGNSSDKCTLRVRSDSGMLSSSILSILNLLISETIL